MTVDSLGAVVGRIAQDAGGESLTLHSGYGALSCLTPTDLKGSLSALEGEHAFVEGRLTRDEKSGRVLAVCDITGITAAPAGAPDDWRRAIGAVPRGTGAPLPEQVIRRLRDEW